MHGAPLPDQNVPAPTKERFGRPAAAPNLLPHRWHDDPLAEGGPRGIPAPGTQHLTFARRQGREDPLPAKHRPFLRARHPLEWSAVGMNVVEGEPHGAVPAAHEIRVE